MLSSQTKHNASRKNFKWSLFIILMIVSLFAYTNSNKSDKFDQNEPVVNTKALPESKTNFIHTKKIDLDEYQSTFGEDEHFAKHSIFNKEHSVLGLVSTEDKENIEQTFQFPGDNQHADNNKMPKFEHFAKFSANSQPGTGHYIQGGSGTGTGGGANAKSTGGSNENESKNGEGTSEENLTAVPVPPAIWLLGSALLGFIGLRKR